MKTVKIAIPEKKQIAKWLREIAQLITMFMGVLLDYGFRAVA